MAKIGILGGSFHPFHNGHLFLGQYCLDQQILDEVWFIPTGVSYLKRNSNMLSGEERLRLLQLAIKDKPAMKALDLEIKRPGNTYTYETLEELKTLYPEDDFYFIIGADCLFTMENWVRSDRIFELCTILAAGRNNVSAKEMQDKRLELVEKYHARIMLLDFPEMQISSTEIRNRLKAGDSIEDLLPKAEADEIIRLGYFRE